MLLQLCAYLLAPFYLAALLWRGRREPEILRGLGERFGAGAELPEPVWLHAASVGEVQAAATLITALRLLDARLPLLVTVTTAAGHARARALFEPSGVAVRYVPMDLPGSVRRFMRRARPRLAIILETEIWPALFRACRQRRMPLILASARISERSARRYRWLGGALREALAGVSAVAAQTSADAARLCALGVPAARITVTGNLKVDLSVPPQTHAAGAALRASFGDARPIWVAGSTHEGEELEVLKAHHRVRQADPRALLLLVPRHPRRFQAVTEWLTREHETFAQLSRPQSLRSDAPVVLVDVMGRLMECYAAADVAFVGGSLVAIGGHNLLEPAALSRAILTGPHHGNAPDILAALQAADAVRVVHDAPELGAAVTALLRDPQARERLAASALAVVEAGRGACDRVMTLLRPLLEESGVLRR